MSTPPRPIFDEKGNQVIDIKPPGAPRPVFDEHGTMIPTPTNATADQVRAQAEQFASRAPNLQAPGGPGERLARGIQEGLGPLGHPIDTFKGEIEASKEALKGWKEHPLSMLLTVSWRKPTAEDFIPPDVLNIKSIAESSRQGDVAGAIGKGLVSGLSLISAMPETGMLKPGVPAVTRGVAPEASRLAEWLEPKLAKIPGNALQQAYQHNQTLLRATLAEGVKGAIVRELPQTGAPAIAALGLNPDEVVANLNKGADFFKTQSRANYQGVDQWIAANKPIAQQVQGMLTPQGLAVTSITPSTFESLKVSIARLNKQAESLLNRGLGTEAHQVANQAAIQENLLNQIKQALPPNLQRDLATADRLWLQKSAAEDLAEVLKKPSVVHGAPPSAQSSLTKVQQQQIGGASLLREATMGDDAARFQQFFGPDTTKQITDLADLIGKQQGAGGAGGNMGMMGSMLIMSAARGGFTRVLSPIAGLDLMARALASPDNWSLIRAMLTGHPAAAATIVAPRLFEQMRQKGELPEYMYEQRPGAPTPTQAPIPGAGVQPATTIPGGASIGDQLRSKGISIPGQQPQVPGLPFHPGAGL